MKSIDLKMTSVEVKTETRPLCVKWPREMATDFQNFDIDNSSEMDAALMKEWSYMARTSERKSKARKIFES